jgi:hypothetical protein
MRQMVLISRGFIVNEEREELLATAPASTAITSTTQFGFSADLSSTKYKERVPRMTEMPTPNPPVTGSVSKLPYQLYTYAAAQMSNGQVPTEELYVFTGEGSLDVRPNTFIPLRELKARLTGNAQDRKAAYAKDWLTFCRWRNQTVAILNSGPYVPKLADLDAIVALDFRDGSHLEVRNSVGAQKLANLTQINRAFLTTLLGPKSTDSIENVPFYIFKKWCRRFKHCPITESRMR